MPAMNMDPDSLRRLAEEVRDLTGGVKELVGNLSGMGTASKGLSTEFHKSNKEVDGINSKLVKEQKKIVNIGLAQAARTISNKKDREKYLKGFEQKQRDSIKRILSLEKGNTKKEFVARLKNDTTEARRKIKEFKKEHLLASKKAAEEKKLDEQVTKNKRARLTKEDRWRDSWEDRRKRKRIYEEKEQQISVQKGVHPGKVAGDITGAASALFRPFKEKSLNPLDWAKTGFEAKEGLQESQQTMVGWSKVLHKEQSKRRSAAKRAAKREREKVITGGDEEGAPAGAAVGSSKGEKKLKNKIGGILGNVANKIGIGSGGAKGAVAKKAASSAGSFGKAAAGLGVLVKVVDALSVALGFLMKANWIFAIIAGIASLVSAGVELDKFFKKLNKTFLEMAGTTLGTGDMIKNMGEFNDAIFSLNRNLKLGLRAEDIQGMFKAMAGTGIIPKNLDKEAGGYGKVIEMVRKTNLDLGVSFEEAGKIIGQQMMDLKDTFDHSRKSLQVMGFEAGKAGVQSNKFYAAIENSVSALSFLGNFTKQASASLTAFMKQSGLSFKDASKAADEYMQVFEKMDWKQMQIALAVAGPAILKGLNEGKQEMFDKPLEGLQTSMGDLEKQLAATTDKDKRKELTDEMSHLGDRINTLAGKEKGYADAIKDYQRTGTAGRIQQYRGLATTSLPTIITDLMQGQRLGSKDFGGDQYTAILEILKKTLGVSDTLMTSLTQQFENLDVNFETLGNSLNNEGVIKELQDGNNALGIKLETLVTNAKAHKDDTRYLDELYSETHDMAKNQLGMVDEEAEAFAGSVKQLVSTGGGADEITDWLKGIYGIDVKNVKKFEKPGLDKQGKILKSSMKAALATEDGFDKLSEQDKDLIRATTSASDYMDIAKDTLKYIAARSMEGMVGGIAKSVLGIAEDVSLLASDKRQKRDDALNKVFITYGEDLKTFTKNQHEYMELVKKRNAETDPTKKEELEKQRVVAFKNLQKQQVYIDEQSKDVLQDNQEFAGQIKQKAGEIVANTRKDILLGTTDEGGNKTGSSDADKVKQDINAPLPVNKDFKTLRGGLALLDKGDMAFSPAAGVAGTKGALLDEVLGKLGMYDTPTFKGAAGDQTAQYSINLGGIHVNGNIEDPMVVQNIGQKLTDMVEQTIRKHERDKMYRAG